MGQIKEETVKGVKWGLLQRFTLQPVALLYGILLARVLSPAETGIMGLTAIFFAVASTLASAGFGSALIRKNDRTEEDCSTMFWFNVGMSLLMAVLLFLAAPWFASFYDEPQLVWLTRISALMMFINSTGGVHSCLLTAQREFKKLSCISIVSTCIAFVVGLSFAYSGFGVWALVIQGSVHGFVNLVLLWVLTPWKPRFIWSNKSFCELFSFGSKLALSGLLHTLYTQVRTFIVGKFYRAEQLGLYSKGEHMAAMLPQTINGMLGSVIYPILVTVQDDDARLASVYRKYLQVTTLPIAWCVCTIMALGYPLVHLLYGEMWTGCVIYVQVICLACGFDHICTINLNLLMVKGRSNLFLKLEIIKKTLSLSLLLAAAFHSVEAICWASALYSQFAVYINAYYTGKIINVTWWKQQKDYWPYFILAILANIPAYCLVMLPLPDYAQILLGGLLSFVIYFGTLHLSKNAIYFEVLSMLKVKMPFLSRIIPD